MKAPTSEAMSPRSPSWQRAELELDPNVQMPNILSLSPSSRLEHLLVQDSGYKPAGALRLVIFKY